MMSRLGYYMLELLVRVIRLIPFGCIEKVSSFFGNLLYYLDSKHRKISLMNLDLAFPRMGKKKKIKISRLHFVNLTRTTLEFFSLPKINKGNFEKYVVHKNKDNLVDAQEKGKGVIFLAAHFGNWELMAFVHPLAFNPAFTLARKFKNKNIDDLINRIRCMSGNGIIDKKNAIYRVLKELKRNNCMGVLMDQSVHPNEAVYVDFFGKFISTTPFVSQVALKTGCAVVPVFDYPGKDCKHVVEYFPEIEMETPQDGSDPILFNTERLNKFIEARVRENPEFWLWSHKRWKNVSEDRCWGRIKKKEDIMEEL